MPNSTLSQKSTKAHTSEQPSAPTNGQASFDFDADALSAGKVNGAAKLALNEDYPLDALGATADAEDDVEREAEVDLSTVTVEKPRATRFVYLHPSWRFTVYLLLPEEESRQFTHLLLQPVGRKYPQICRKADLFAWADQGNGLHLWPVLLENQAGSISEYSVSARARIKQGAGQWARYAADVLNQRYRLYFALEQRPAPQWPDGGIEYLIRTAFCGRILSDPNDELLLRRLGRAG